MEKSIENIWKDGFVKNEKMLIPRINNLYNQKSKNMVEHFRNAFLFNLRAILIVASIILVVACIAKMYLFGISIFLLLSFVVFIGKKEFALLNELDMGLSSYDYLKSFDDWLQKNIKLFTRIYRFFYPLFFFSFVLGIHYSFIGDFIREEIVNDPSTIFLFGIPVIFTIPLFIFGIPLIFFGGKIYEFDLQLVYGRQIEKLKELLHEMEILRK